LRELVDHAGLGPRRVRKVAVYGGCFRRVDANRLDAGPDQARRRRPARVARMRGRSSQHTKAERAPPWRPSSQKTCSRFPPGGVSARLFCWPVIGDDRTDVGPHKPDRKVSKSRKPIYDEPQRERGNGIAPRTFHKSPLHHCATNSGTRFSNMGETSNLVSADHILAQDNRSNEDVLDEVYRKYRNSHPFLPVTRLSIIRRWALKLSWPRLGS